MALMENRPDQMANANGQYLAAVQMVRKDLATPQVSQSSQQPRQLSNEVLQSVLLLDLYEKINLEQHTLGPSASWLSHINGALGIIQSRLSIDYRNSATAQLIHRTIISLTSSLGVIGARVPFSVSDLIRNLHRYSRDAKLTYLGLLTSVMDLRADMRSGSFSVDDVITKARELQSQLADAQAKVPRSWRPYREASHSLLVFGTHYDMYPSHYSTQVLNAFRMLRLDLCAVIRSLRTDPSVDAIIVKVTQEICAAVPQFLLVEASAENSVPLSPMQMLKCRAVLTPLFKAAQTTMDESLRDWVLLCLDFMSQNGLKPAQEVADMLRFSPEVDYWSVYTMIGGCGITA
ncbi:hypothetical protein F5X68DRAFT_252465 [Plectosphaerella plurivora]|uniref:Uncharacterized protein n=1 Tax=Plectosphaerella plurivora TaxID=936078 RepID=A0A9P9ACU8_9PEZI|nr:hypothetical protein F5X68DRAFT_252465 [Plectosphaerella plurivora]